MSEYAHHPLQRHLRTIQGVATIIAVLILIFVVPKIQKTPASTNQNQTTHAPVASSSTPWIVTKVVDGDTIDVTGPDGDHRVRLLGINTPETVDPRRPVQCFGHEASDFAKNLMADQAVRLEADASQDDQDKYGRQLRYVFLADDTLVNEKLITEGYAYEYTFSHAYRYQTQFRNAQRAARLAGRGLWAADTCNGQKTSVK